METRAPRAAPLAAAAGLYSETLRGSSGFAPSMPTVGKRMPEMFHTMGLSESSKTKCERRRASTTSVKNAGVRAIGQLSVCGRRTMRQSSASPAARGGRRSRDRPPPRGGTARRPA